MSEVNPNLLYGKSLHTLVTSALISLEHKQVTNVLVKTVIEEIFIRRPELKELIKESRQKRDLESRIRNCIRKMASTNLIEIDRKKAIDIDHYYITIKSNLK